MRGKVKKIIKSLDLYYYELLLRISKFLEDKFTSIITKYPAKKEEDLNLIAKFATKQLNYLNRESIYYTRSFIYAGIIFILCTIAKPILWLFVIVNMFKLFCMPKKSYHKLTYKYIYNTIVGMPLIILTTIFSGGIGIFLGAISSWYYLNMCNQREFEDKYIYYYSKSKKCIS